MGARILVRSWLGARGAGTAPQSAAGFAPLIGVVVGLVGVALWVRNSLTRYLRYWLIRLIYEDREQTERLIAAIEKLAEK